MDPWDTRFFMMMAHSVTHRPPNAATATRANECAAPVHSVKEDGPAQSRKFEDGLES